MSIKTSIHPDAVLEGLAARPHRSNVSRTLIALHELCRKHHQAGLRDFSLACIGRKAEDAGLIGSRSLYNPGSQVYRDLIQAWAAYAGPPVVHPPKNLASHEYLLKIHDPAIRMIMQAIIAERDTLKAQINLIKGSNHGTMDLRPLGATVASNQEVDPALVLIPDARLTEGERDALKSAISVKFLTDEGWSECERGEIKNSKGRVLFRPGFTFAIRKILGERPQPGVKVVS